MTGETSQRLVQLRLVVLEQRHPRRVGVPAQLVSNQPRRVLQQFAEPRLQQPAHSRRELRSRRRQRGLHQRKRGSNRLLRHRDHQRQRTGRGRMVIPLANKSPDRLTARRISRAASENNDSNGEIVGDD